MRTKLIKTVFVVAIAMLSGVNVFKAQQTEAMSDVAMANVEALADVEEVDLRRGYILVEKSKTCSICEWTGGDIDYCDVHEQLPDCY